MSESALAQLSEYEAETLGMLMFDRGRTRQGNGPWERSWYRPTVPAESAALARLYNMGLIERQLRYGGRRGPFEYRWRAKP